MQSHGEQSDSARLRVQDAMAFDSSSDGDVVGLDPLLLSALASLVVQLIAKCAESQLFRQRAAVARRPDGRVATAIKETLRKDFVHRYPMASDVAVLAHVDRGLAKFAAMSDQELMELREQSQKEPVELKWEPCGIQGQVNQSASGVDGE